jgi:hypothetical protein
MSDALHVLIRDRATKIARMSCQVIPGDVVPLRDGEEALVLREYPTTSPANWGPSMVDFLARHPAPTNLMPPPGPLKNTYDREAEALERMAAADEFRNDLLLRDMKERREWLAKEAKERRLFVESLSDPRDQQGYPAEVAAEVGPEPARGPWFVLRDPVSAPAGWVNQVKVAHPTRQDAAEAADRLARSTGGRFLLLETTAYVDPAPSIFHEGSPSTEELPF